MCATLLQQWLCHLSQDWAFFNTERHARAVHMLAGGKQLWSIWIDVEYGLSAEPDKNLTLKIVFRAI